MSRLKGSLVACGLVSLGFGLGVMAHSWEAQAKTTTSHSAAESKSSPQIKVLFSPNEDVQSEIVRALNGARAQILVQAYLLTDDKITNALIAAQNRHVHVQVLLDAERSAQSKGSDAVALAQAGIPVRLETQYENAHNKVIIIDAGLPSELLITGSYNFTYTAATKNAENILFISHAPDLVTRYVWNWSTHNKQAVPYK